ncbi:RM55 protein, partial [Atractosteus spatula]|nr:RM55 protein [Atractosteus spatula]
FLQEGGTSRSLPASCAFHSSCNLQNSNRTSIVQYGRQSYGRMYPVLLVRCDGSTVNIRYKEPKRILTMPVDISTLSEEERKARLQKRDARRVEAKPAKEEIKDDFNVDDYSKFWKKK